MTNDSIYQFLFNIIQQVIQKASDFKIYIGSSYSVSIIQFFLALSITAIVLRSLINFVSSVYIYSASESLKQEERKTSRRYKRK